MDGGDVNLEFQYLDIGNVISSPLDMLRFTFLNIWIIVDWQQEKVPSQSLLDTRIGHDLEQVTSCYLAIFLLSLPSEMPLVWYSTVTYALNYPVMVASQYPYASYPIFNIQTL